MCSLLVFGGFFFLFLVSVLFSWPFFFFERKKEHEVGWAEVRKTWEDVEERKEYEQNILKFKN